MGTNGTQYGIYFAYHMILFRVLAAIITVNSSRSCGCGRNRISRVLS
jgi:hypothetical protein